MYLLLFLLAFPTAIKSVEYMYPVAACSAEQVYVLYQKSTDHIELWLWNSITKKASKALLSTFSPAGLQLLPDGTSFSFIDNDRIRVKVEGRRQPKSIDFSDPLYDISLIHWIDNESFYFSAKEHERYGIFHGTVYGTCHRIINIDDGHCMYPQLQGTDLFYIERHDDNSTAIVSVPYPAIPHDECSPCTDSEKLEKRVLAIMEQCVQENQHSYADISQKSLILNFSNKSISFLKMLSDSYGLILEHPVFIDRSDNMIPFTCHALQRTQGTWSTYELFSFELPAQLLIMGRPERLHESLLPLLLRYDGKKSLFFLNTNKNDLGLNIYEYRFDDRSITKRSNNDQNRGMFFSPLCSKFGIWYGGTLTVSDELLTDNVCMYFDNDGDVCFNLPLMGE